MFAKKLFRILLNFLIYVAVFAATIYGLPNFLSWALNTPYPMAAITSGSMWPVLKEGDLVFIQRVKPPELKVGDIVVYRTDSGGFVIHRLVRMENGRIITKGDANFKEDNPVDYKNIIGRAFKIGDRLVHIPYLGSITVMANNFKKNNN